jgi:hypothetical protein
MASMTDGKLDPQQDGRARDREAVIPMMRYWAQHMRDIADVLPAGRSLLIRTGDITGRMDELAAVCGVPRQTLRDDLSHANRAPHTLDRLALYDDPQIREAYRVHCADIMADVFPEAHERVFLVPASGLDWEAHCDAAHAWVSEAVQKYGEAVGR